MRNKKKPFWRLFGYLRPYWPGYAFGGTIGAISEAIFNLLLAFTLKGLIDAAVYGDTEYLLRVILQCGGGLLLLCSTIPWSNRMVARSVEAATLDIRQELFDHIQDLPVSYHEQTHSNDTISRLTNDVQAAKMAFGNHLLQLVAQIVTALACAVYMIFISWKLLVLALVIGTLPLIFNHFTAKPLQDLGKKAQQNLADLNSRLKDMLTGMPVVRSFGLEKQFSKTYRSANTDNLETRLQRNRLQAVVNTANMALGSSNFMALFAFSAFLLIRGELTAGDMMAAVQISQGIINPFSMLGEIWVAWQSSIASGSRIFEVIDVSAEPNEPMADAPLCEVDSAVSFQQVSFSYGEQAVLNEVSFDVPHGNVVALVGPSGGGKSTLFKLILSFHQTSSGRICVGKRDIASYSLEELRGMLSYVPQDAYLYTGTIYENIACAKDGASRAEVEAAARSANAHDFIMSLPNGYDTQAGERGTQLSGGQRQRIAIARALLKDSPILLLDEATSSLDGESERLVQEALERLMKGRTTLVIAHRLSTVRNADCIHVIADGQVAESGTHEELLALDGIYKRLHDMQIREAA